MREPGATLSRLAPVAALRTPSGAIAGTGFSRSEALLGESSVTATPVEVPETSPDHIETL